LLQLGLLIRGAITVGDAFHSDTANTVFGPAVNRAVSLEQEVAIAPRVIIDSKLLESFNANESPYLKQDSDGYWFVNGFWLLSGGTYPMQTKVVIEHGLNESKINERYRQKWQWIAIQFNEELEKNKVANVKKIIL
jgi:hypothetical protein